MIKYITQHNRVNQVASIYCNSQCPEAHLTGSISFISEDALVLNHITADGRYDGFILIHASDIFRVDFDGEYERKIQTLYRYRKQQHPLLPQNESLYLSLLHFCEVQNLVITVELEDSALTGFLAAYDYDFIHLLLLDEYGRRNGETVVSSDEIVSIAVDTSTEQNIRILYYEGYQQI